MNTVTSRHGPGGGRRKKGGGRTEAGWREQGPGAVVTVRSPAEPGARGGCPPGGSGLAELEGEDWGKAVTCESSVWFSRPGERTGERKHA